ncbi:PAS domain S-box protein [Alloacidobacterium sp.]|uniref:sensor histidine kinase n=1 Tax=Alloacidobacterium sp. TaxID=2951999 RepID=UPI002D36D016|nr:PAS domain S-box protein [Alloacidobacterium sp.]HYK36601.1 PAS domain S-box protein [Alloacidobacterium sp.]
MGIFRGTGQRNSLRRFSARALGRYLYLILCILLCVLIGPDATSQPNAKNVLVLYPYGEPPSFAVLKSTMQAHIPGQINFYTTSMSNRRFEEEDYQESLAETFRRGYSGIKLDVVIASTYPVLQFAVRYRNKMFPGVPIVFFDVYPNEWEGQKILPGVTGVVVPLAMHETIDLALHLHPDTSTVAVITGTSEWERYWLELAHSELLRYRDKVREIDILGLPAPQMLERIAALPPHTVVLFQLAPHDSNEATFGYVEVLSAAAQRLPIYSVYPGLGLTHGGIGGAYRDIPKDVKLTGEMAARVVSGERPENIPIVRDSSVQVEVDWRALQHWHIRESALPPGSLILDRPPTIWEQYRKYLLASIALIVAQTLLIIGLLWQRARKRKAEAVMRESEERFRVMADSTPSLVWMCDSHGKVTYLNERRIAFTGPEPTAGYGDSWIAYIHPDDMQNVLDALFKALKERRPFSKEYRLRRSDGVYRRMFDVASPRMNGDGSFAGFIGSAIDVTDQKLAQQTLEKVSGRLIEAQEQERGRIARELHDDICQRLALLSMEIEQANRNANGSSKNLEEIRKHCSEIAGDVQSLSHQLHSSKLDYLGVVAAIRGFCSEFSKQHDVNIEFMDRNVPGNLPKEVSLCLFRVAQEALHNAVKYSGVSQFSVKISSIVDEVRLEVRDAGAGFEAEEAKSRGLGLVSMQERVHLVHGRLSVESQPGKGTVVLAIVPLVVQNGESLEDGALNETSSVTRMA